MASVDNKDHILRAIQSNVRYDGRKNNEYRPVTIEYGVSWTAEGSAKVSIGDTTIIAGVKLSAGEPYADNPDEGTLMIEAGLLPLSSPLFETGPPGIDAVELARVIDRGIRESHSIDTHALCIKKGEKVWTVTCDICTVNADGNLFDAASLAAMAALKNAVFPEISSDGTVEYKKKTKKSLPLVQCPIAITVWKAGELLCVDPTQGEENVFEARLTITTIEDGSIVAMQKGGEGTLTSDDITRMIDLALEKAQFLRKHL